MIAIQNTTYYSDVLQQRKTQVLFDELYTLIHGVLVGTYVGYVVIVGYDVTVG